MLLWCRGLRLVAEGARVVLADLESSGGEEGAAQIGRSAEAALFQATDARSERHCQRAVEAAVGEFGGLDVRVNNDGTYPRSTLEQTTEEFWDKLPAINLKKPFLLCKHVVPIHEAARRRQHRQHRSGAWAGWSWESVRLLPLQRWSVHNDQESGRRFGP
ncbi:MAG: SDR family oxidoreductase [Acidobacteria bacterium]|nr:SDR family oxidoreductase [Acidobacteriota bacterium]